MLTERLFDQDPYLRHFEARIIQHTEKEGSPAVALDRTCFYPNAGGQPCDLGTLSGVPVTDVFEEGEAIVHVLARPLSSGETVSGEIDWQRRFDHMQQHSGQHILSQVFLRVASAPTIGFHLGDTSATIDVGRADIPNALLRKIEDAANAAVLDNHRVVIHTVDAETIHQFDLRRDPVSAESIRVVEIEGVDQTGCCGTHVRQTCEVGPIAIIRCENYKGGSRVTFLCGWRAIRDHQVKTEILREVCQKLTVGQDELSGRIDRLHEERQAAAKKIRVLTEAALEGEARILMDDAKSLGEVRLVTAQFEDRDPKDMQKLVRNLIIRPGVIAAIGVQSERGYLLIGRSADLDLDVRPILTEAVRSAEGRGGGRPDLAQASFADPAQCSGVLKSAIDLIIKGAP